MITVVLDVEGTVVGLHADHASSVTLEKVDATLRLMVSVIDDVERSVTIELNEERPFLLQSENASIVQEEKK